MAPPSGSAPPQVFYGWWVALALSVIVFLSSGIRFTIGPFLKPVSADLGVDRGSFSLVIALSLLLYGAFMPLVGRLVDRMGSRVVCSAGAVVMAASLVLTSRMTTLWEFYLYYAVVGSLGLAATGHVMGSVTLANWFVKRRGVAMSFLGSASMAGMAILVPLAMWCILRFGWRTSFVLLGIGALIIMLPLTVWVLRDDPESLGLEPDGVPAAAARRPGRATSLIERTAIAEAIQVPSFWLLTAGLFNCGFSMSLLSAHGVPMLTDHGFHPMAAASAIGFLGMTAIGGGIMLGLISDRWGRKPVLAAVYLLRLVAFGMLFLVRDPVLLLVVAAIGGVGMSGSLAMTSALTGDIFGRYSVGSIFGLIFLSHQTGSSLGSWLGGFLFDVTGGYGAAFGVAGALLLIAAILSLSINERARPASRAVPIPSRPQPVAGGS
ncbi:MAG TPA: MFS transporter [Candidatus Limnocylindria bacterium]|nr:MFS transporter [Candidatus Limnocylindria bacterium]